MKSETEGSVVARKSLRDVRPQTICAEPNELQAAARGGLELGLGYLIRLPRESYRELTLGYIIKSPKA